MSGHSHWAKIKRAKADTDAKRGRLWSKLARRVIVAARTGGAKPDENLALRYAIDEARAANMPNDTIKKAIKKGTGELGAENYKEVIYEGYGPGGVAFLIYCLSDNRNRTAADVRKIFERAGGQLGSTNCVAWMFEQTGSFVISADAGEETLIRIALAAGADDVKREADLFEITCDAGAFSAVKEALAEKQIQTISAELTQRAKTTVAVSGEKARRVVNLAEALEDLDDVQNVYANFEVPDELLTEAEKKL